MNSVKGKKVLVTGGLGYIGSHTIVELVKAGFEPVILDDLSNSEFATLERLEKLSNKKIKCFVADLSDLVNLNHIFLTEKIDAVIHFAAKKSVEESTRNPLMYFRSNVVPLITLLESMTHFNIPYFVFSSSATVYGVPEKLPITEEAPLKKPLSAYGSTKQMGEEILEKTTLAMGIQAIALRYFNPVGAHPTGLIGELPKGTPSNLFPYLTQTAAGIRKTLTVFGDDYATIDGTCIRDYIHVQDLAQAHVAACEYLFQNKTKAKFDVFNVGTGKGTSVLEMIHAFERITGVKVNYSLGARRPGDAPVVYADVSKINNQLGWKAKLSLDNIITSGWSWQKSLIADKK